MVMIHLFLLFGFVTYCLGGNCVSEVPSIPQCEENEEYSDKKKVCPPQSCESLYTTYLCASAMPEPGCNCMEGYLRDANNVCIPSEECEIPDRISEPKTDSDSNGYSDLVLALPECGENEVARYSRTICPPQSCDIIHKPYECEPQPTEPGCDCICGYLRNSEGVCIPKDECPKPAPKCHIPLKCRPTCAVPNPRNCPKVEPAISNIDGCHCQKGYILSQKGGKCLKIEECPKQNSCNGDPHAIIKACPWACPPTCANPESARCKKECKPVGCQCEPGYILSKENGNCILPDRCKGGNPCGRNNTFVDCAFVCPNVANCPTGDGSIKLACNAPPAPCPPGCVCKENYKKLNGKCVLQSDCPKLDCNGDTNAMYTTCPNPCPATCKDPEPGPCNKKCLSTGCQCKPGYLLSQGKCILSRDCPGGVSCPANEQFVFCKADCITSFCPENDSRGIILCDPPDPCPSGCSCKAGYLRKSVKDTRCIEASKCPPVKCTRPNEVWSPSPPNCLNENCDDAKKPPEPCNKPYRDYTPKCICKNGYYRNSSDICILASECV